MRLFQNANFEFLHARRRAYVVSAAVLLLGLGSIILHGGLRFGVDFTGGTLYQIEFAEEVSVADVRDVMADVGFGEAQIQRFGSSSEFLIRVQEFEASGDSSVEEAVREALTNGYGDNWEIARREALSARVGSELQRGALIAILISFGLTLIYLAFRFEWRFGVAAVIATIHDILITFGFISLMNIEISLSTVAAILTIVGYSLNDTIVVFDRIRENIKKYRKLGYIDLLNRSINETLPRTVLTSATTVMTLFALFLLGGEVIRPFALVLILGVLIGTYSSIFVASPALLEIENRSGHATESAKKR
ncbi:MAG TPA: protein translocase subunit SecF [Gemmatimonadota bacterium]|nr:protein translocase subunit SecF [Gemmatimonadota bacterium]